MNVVSFPSPVAWIKANSVMLFNAGSLVATTGVTSVLGFAYWWVAARRFSPEAVGIASTSTSAMMLIGGLCTLGFSTLLITELPRKPALTGPLISTALLTVGGVSAVTSLAFALVAPYISPQYQPLRANPLDVLILVIGISLSAMTLVFDQSMIGLLHGELQFWRNIVFSSVKLLGLFVVGLWFSRQDGMSIYAAWAFGSVLSLLITLAYAAYRKVLPFKTLMPRFGLLKNLGLAAFQHHLLNTMLQVPMQVLPLLVTAFLSAQVTAWFFTSWQLVNFVFLIPSSLTTVLHAMNSAQPSVLARKARSTMGLAFLVAVLVDIVLVFAPKLVLSPFGAAYAAQASWCLRILSLAAFPLIIKSHYISICRIHDRITFALYSMLPGSVLEVVAAAVGAHFGGLTGLSAGWVLAVFVESVFMIPTVYTAVWPSKKELAAQPVYAGMEADPVWSMDTLLLPTLSILAQSGQGYAGLEDIWRVETVTMPSISKVVKERNTAAMNAVRVATTPASSSTTASPSRQGKRIHPLSLPSLATPQSWYESEAMRQHALYEQGQTPSFRKKPPVTPITDPILQRRGWHKISLNPLPQQKQEQEQEFSGIDQLSTVEMEQVPTNDKANISK